MTKPAGAELLLASGQCRAIQNLPYAGDIDAQDAFTFMQSHPSLLVDVRTPSEWRATGIADLRATPSQAACISWRQGPDFAVNPHFAADIAALPAIARDIPIFFLCKSGGRSLDAALAMTAEGYRHCFNITGGFEGQGSTPGWKARPLPWMEA